jgi:hypothetical protein
VSGVTYDSGALIAAERRSRPVWVLHKRALERGAHPTVPAGALSQAWRGGPQAELSRFLRGCRVEALTEERARFVGGALAASKGSDVIDASVVVGALTRGDLVVTGDPDDLRRIASALGRRVALQPI